MTDIYLNSLSFTCATQAEASSLLETAFREALNALDWENPRGRLVCRGGKSGSISLGEDILLQDACEALRKPNPTLYEWLLELRERCVDIDGVDGSARCLEGKHLPHITGFSPEAHHDFAPIFMSHESQNILLSLNSDPLWANDTFNIHWYRDAGCCVRDSAEIRHISDNGHGREWRLRRAPSSALIPNFGSYEIDVYPDDHMPPHFHIVKKGEKCAGIAIANLEAISGKLPHDREARSLMTWVRKNREILRRRWEETHV